MKRLFALLMLLSVGLAQAQPRTAVVIADCTITLDGEFTGGTGNFDIITMPLWVSTMRGYPHMLINPNAVKASSATDSLSLEWRPCVGSTLADSLGAATFAYVADWRNAAANVNFNAFDWADSAWYWGVLDLEGQTPEWIQVRAWLWGASANDSCALRIKMLDIQK